MWELSGVSVSDKEKIEKELREGYEPFAVSEGIRGETIWLRRKVTGDKILRSTQQGDTPKPRRSRADTTEPKA